jgi:hypothetical protein
MRTYTLTGRDTEDGTRWILTCVTSAGELVDDPETEGEATGLTVWDALDWATGASHDLELTSWVPVGAHRTPVFVRTWRAVVADPWDDAED